MNNQLTKKLEQKTIQKTQTFSVTKVFITVISIMAASIAAFAAMYVFLEKDAVTEPATEIALKDRLVIEGVPFKILTQNPNSPIAFGDIDQDLPGQEFAFCGEDGLLYVYHIEPYNYGAYPVAGFPQPGCPTSDLTSSAPALGDIDNDGLLEIAVGTSSAGLRGSKLFVYNHDGTVMNDNWPMQPYPYISSQRSITLANTNDDEYLELIVSSDTSSNFSTFIYDINGKQLAELELGNMTEVAIADLDNDGAVEIVVGETHREENGVGYYTYVSVYDAKGNELPGEWPVTIEGTIQTNFAIGDVDTTTKELEIVAESSGIELEGAYFFSDIYVWDYQGNNISASWPKRLRSQVPVAPSYTGVSLANIVKEEGAKDDPLEIVASQGTDLYILNYTGENVSSNWPINIDTYVINPPLIGDFNDDGISNIIAAGFYGISDQVGKLCLFDQEGNNPLNPTDDSIDCIHQVEEGIIFGPAAADFDNDGKTEIIYPVWSEENTGDRGIYRLDLNWAYDTVNMEWPQFEHDGANTGNYHTE